MSDDVRHWIAPVGLLCLSLAIFGVTTFAQAVLIFVLFLIFVMICVWANSQRQ